MAVLWTPGLTLPCPKEGLGVGAGPYPKGGLGLGGVGLKLCTNFPLALTRRALRRVGVVSAVAVSPNLMKEMRNNPGGLLNLNYWMVKDYYRLVQAVNSLELRMRKLSNEQLRLKTDEFRRQIMEGKTLEDIEAEAFAVVREASRRTLGMRHFDVQIIGGAVLHDGAIAEMKTGEGKTLVSPLAAYLNALTGEGVHVVTVNDYLAQRDAEWMGQIHRFLGLSVGLVQRAMDVRERKQAYGCDITFVNNTEIGFDYLRDNMAQRKEEQVLRWPKPFNYVIIDEVDSVLIDEGRNPLLISAASKKDVGRYPVAAKVSELLTQNRHYKLDHMDKSVELTEEGIEAAEMMLETDDLWNEKDSWARFIISAICAKEFYQQDVHYIVKDGDVRIVDEFTGRVMENRRWSEGLHQSVEAKEGVEIKEETRVAAQITNQSLYKLYSKLSGMTGTAKTEEKEFLSIFQMPVVEIPTNLPNIRRDFPLQLYATMEGKWQSVKEEVIAMYTEGRPVLVGTTSVEQSEYLSELLMECGIPHNVLNARPKYAAREAEIVAQAGRKRAITIATNMAGRGTDIILGGNPDMLAKEIIEEDLSAYLTQESPDTDKDGAPVSHLALSMIHLSPASLGKLAKAIATAKFVIGRGGESWSYEKAKSKLASFLELTRMASEDELEKLAGRQGAETISLGPAIALAYTAILKDCQDHCRKEGEEVKRLGGLHVIGTSIHESRRIDNQLRGRAGRQGDPGSTRFIISLDDELIQRAMSRYPFFKNLLSPDTYISGNGFLEKQVDARLHIDEIALIVEIKKQILGYEFSSLKLSAWETPNLLGIMEHKVMVYGIQQSFENHYSSIRKSLVDFEEVLEVQRKHVYGLRQSLLIGDFESRRQCLFQFIQDVSDEIVFPHVSSSKSPKQWNISKIIGELQDFLTKVANEDIGSFKIPTEDMVIASLMKIRRCDSVHLDSYTLPDLPSPPHQFDGPKYKSYSYRRWMRVLSNSSMETGKYLKEVTFLRKYIGDVIIGMYREKLFVLDTHPRDIEQIERLLAISALDMYWREHLVNMSRLRSAVNVRSFGNLNPLEEYKIESLRFFIAMLSSVRRLTVESLLRPWMHEFLEHDSLGDDLA